MAKWTKQTYEMVADILHKHLIEVTPGQDGIPRTTYQEGHVTATSDIATDFANWFARDNGAFDRAKFIEAVNTGKHIRTSIREA
jgi:hypothetical protein